MGSYDGFNFNFSGMDKKILIVDDHFIVRSGMSLLLENELDNVQVFDADDFPKALSALDTTSFDLVILDINLPDGRECDMIDDLRKLQRDLKIVMFSAYDEDIYAVRYIEAGANGYLNKFSNDTNSIINAIKTVLK